MDVDSAVGFPNEAKAWIVRYSKHHVMEIATMVWSQRLLSLLSHGGTTEQEQGHADCLFRRYEREWWWLIRNEDGERAHPMEIKSGGRRTRLMTGQRRWDHACTSKERPTVLCKKLKKKKPHQHVYPAQLLLKKVLTAYCCTGIRYTGYMTWSELYIGSKLAVLLKMP